MIATANYTGFTSALQAMQTAVQWFPITEAECFPAQWQTLTDERQFQVWDCSRRAAKTGTAIRRTVKRSSERPGWRTLYIHHTRTLGKQQFYETGDAKNPGVRELLKSHGIAESHHDLTELNVHLGNGSFIQVVGCDDAKDVGKKLGFQWDDILIDEAQEFNDDLLDRLVMKTILPTLVDRRGSLTLMGTPSEVEAGLWYKVKTDPELKGNGYHHWTLLDNPFIDPANIVSIYSKLGYVIDFADPYNNAVVVQREIFGLQVIDKTKLLYEYSPGLNDWPVSGPPFADDFSLWCFAMGVDVGGVSEDNDKDAVVVLGWLKNDPEHRIYERESWTDRGDSEAFCNRVVATYRRWRPMYSACGDTGGAGAVKALAWIAERMEGLQFTSKPTSVETSQRFLNDELRSGRLLLNPLGEIVKGMKTCLKSGHEADIAAAARYAFHGATHHLAKKPEAKPTKTLDQIIREQRCAARRQENRELRDPYQQEGGWTG